MDKKMLSSRTPKLLPIWLVLLICVIGIYGTGVVYRGLFMGDKHQFWMGVSVVLLSTSILGRVLARAWYTKRKLRVIQHKSATR